MNNNNNNDIQCVGCGKLTVGNKKGEYSDHSGTATINITFPKHTGIGTMQGLYCINCALKLVNCLKNIKE